MKYYWQKNLAYIFFTRKWNSIVLKYLHYPPTINLLSFLLLFVISCSTVVIVCSFYLPWRLKIVGSRRSWMVVGNSLTGKIAIPRSRVNILTSHIGLLKNKPMMQLFTNAIIIMVFLIEWNFKAFSDHQ